MVRHIILKPEAVGLSKDDLKLTDEVPHVVIRKQMHVSFAIEQI